MSRRNETSMPVVPRIAMGNSMIFGFPPHILTKLRYVDTYALVSTSGALAKQVMNVNNIFDPDQTGVGHQPLYRDTYATLYDQYAVVSCNIKLQFQNLATGTGSSFGAVIEDDTSSSSSATTLMEQNLGKHGLLPPLLGSVSNRTINLHWDCKQYLGIDPFTSQTYKTAMGSGPSESAHVVAWAVPADGSTTATVQVQVTMDFTVYFTELTTPTIS